MAGATPKLDQSISGDWQGFYRYSGGQTVPFLAHLTEMAGGLSGSTVEPEGIHNLSFRAATLSGAYTGTEVSFIKAYLDPPPGYCTPIAYDGQVSDDRQVITGRWIVSGISGTFEMQREVDIEEVTGIEIAIGVDEPAHGLAPVSGASSLIKRGGPVKTRPVLLIVSKWPGGTMAMKFGYAMRRALCVPDGHYRLVQMGPERIFRAETHVSEAGFRRALAKSDVSCPGHVHFVELGAA